jgi:hypothetical protein
MPDAIYLAQRTRNRFYSGGRLMPAYARCYLSRTEDAEDAEIFCSWW